MAQIVKELRVDVSQPNVFQAIVAKQHDSNSRFLKITLVDFGVKVEVPNTAKVTINANRPDGASESFKGEANNDGTITVPLAQWMLDIDGEVLVISQFTLCADIRKGNRPSFTTAAPPDMANELYEYFIEQLKANGIRNVEHGSFGADMKVDIQNDGPVTILMDTDIWVK